ncbi:sterol desaturase family protein [Enterovibrio nigricans]|uniref:Sterol desaturase/sphingolipid hydroxylase, fatty acid hydroxylase superfamily n=1 Tax=Enterovibrio nigricans DSM 22720 TaxID=1121868 RepID=A0A1T4VR63_9GAMM|nr:sterol desaturase family protein [Enterovibrio nigricans]SKA66981.1 Sterol desaturase/sphingolipid hydroxylase, fatty acid hydroxylase superfamily [Enterovibrio nigricans DSM 22720]
MESGQEALTLLLLAPLFFICMVVEYRILKKRGDSDYSLKEVVCNFSLAGFHQAADLIATLLLMPFFLWLYQFRLLDISLTPFAFVTLFILQDFFYYWFHRASHHIHWLWASHIAHHSSEKMNFTTAFRQSLTYPISGMWLFWTPLIVIGFPPSSVVLIVALNLGFQFFVHTRIVKKLEWIETIFNTPSHHRVHHARNPEYIDRNFAGVLIIWDKGFGTFVEEKPDVVIDYGIPKQVNSWNPFVATFHQWRTMLGLALSAKPTPLNVRFRYLFGTPKFADDAEKTRKM